MNNDQENELEDQSQGVARNRSRSREMRSQDENRRSPSPQNRSRSRERRISSLDDLVDGSSDSLTEGQWTKDKLPDPLPNELEFTIADPKSFAQGKSIQSPIKELQGSFRFRMLVFPMGTHTTGRPEQLGAFVEVVPPDDCREVRWMFEHVRYLIAVINWKDYRKTTCQQDTFTFQRDSIDRGWHRGFLKAVDMTQESGWLNEKGELCLRAACQARRAMCTIPSGPIGGVTNWRSVGYVGLKNHGATCYMNGLLQTLFHIGRFRHIVYSIDCPESVEQGAASGDDGVDAGDERQALPLLVALQNLFYRLQTSDMVVSCRELMRSFGWDTADAFMQHDVQELNRLLCDRVEEQMKNTSMDGAIKRLFEGEMENYIECVDVDCRSTRVETFYDLQLNVRNDAGNDLTSIEESLRDFTSEETLEGDNAYDAGSFGKQRARKGIRFKRFPPVLHFQLKRFMFDVERLDMCKLNGRLEFPQMLDMEPFAPGSGKYTLHTVVVHSGGVSSGHYYAFVRVRDSENATQWLKFDDEQVSLCSEHAAVDDNYGGEDLDLWNYFSMSAAEIQEQQPPVAPRIHNAYMLSYVRADQAEEILKPPNLEEGSQDTPYHRMVDRCVREARLVEERKRNKLEQLSRIEVKLLLESNLQELEGFWTHTDMKFTKKLRMSRDQRGEDLYQEVAEHLDVPQTDIALFLLNLRRSKQARFTWLNPNQMLRSHIPAQGAPHNLSCEPSFIVLCITRENLDAWSDDVRMLIIKYFCPQTQNIVCLGCYIGLCDVPVEGMLNDGEQWFERRLRPFIEKKQIMPPASLSKLQCWEEYCVKRPEDILERTIKKTIAAEQLHDGDVLIWQPECEEIKASAAEVACFVTINSQQFPVIPKTLVDCMHTRKLQEYARMLFSTLGKTKIKSLPPVNDDSTRLSEWIQAAFRTCFETDGCEDIEMHEDSNDSEMEVDLFNGDRTLEIEKVPRTPDLFARMRNDFPVGTVREKVNAISTQVQVMVRTYNAVEVLCPVDGIFDLPPDTLLAGEMKDMMVDMRWPVSTFMARIMEAFDVNIDVSSLWLFERGAPTQVDDEPCFCTEDFAFDSLPPTLLHGIQDNAFKRSYRSANSVLLDLLKNIYETGGQNGNGWLFHVAVIERPRNPKTERPVKIHFFNNRVQEVGTCILYLPVEPQEESSSRCFETGRPALDPLQLLNAVRNFLSKDEKLLAQLSPQGSNPFDADELPLRVADVFQGRYRRLSCSPKAGIQISEEETADRPQRWPAFGENFLAVPLRIEPNWECVDAGQYVSCEPKQLIEVLFCFHNNFASGHPCLLHVEDTGDLVEKASDLLQEKMQVSDVEMAKWQIREKPNGDRTQRPCLCVENMLHSHRTRSRAESPVRSLRGQKPLTIRGGG